MPLRQRCPKDRASSKDFQPLADSCVLLLTLGFSVVSGIIDVCAFEPGRRPPMLTLPETTRKKKTPYISIRAELSMSEIGERGPRALGEVAAWAASRGIATQAAFFRYNIVERDALLDMEFGFFTEKAIKGDALIEVGFMPAGRYISLTWLGSPHKLYDVTAMLIGWGKERGIAWDCSGTQKGRSFGCRMEIYKTDPVIEPDMEKWETEVVIKLAG
jgi:effector-binding domain-containing protein